MKILSTNLAIAVVPFALCFGFSTLIRGQAETVEPPVAGRPDDFSGLVGFYRISSTAQPTEVCVEDPVTLLVRITGEGPAPYRPERHHLRLFPKKMSEDFYVEAVPDRDRYLEKEKTWEFAYRLRPKHLGVKMVPGLKLVYYLPGRKKFQSTYAEAIGLVVKPRPEAKPPAEVVQAVRPAAGFFELASGRAVLGRDGSGQTSWVVIMLLFSAPPVLCVLWYRRWLRLHPADSQLIRQRKSRAAQLVLRTLGQEKDAPVTEIAGLVAHYLRQRLDVPAAEPTPVEVVQYLYRLGVSKAVRGEFGNFFQACDAGRFAPSSPVAAKHLAAQAINLIHSLEAEPCFSRAS